MENYNTSLMLLGLRDQNLPVFKETRARRLASIEKMNKLINVLPRLAPKAPANLIVLDEHDPEWDDRMIFPTVNWKNTVGRLSYWGFLTTFYAYNWNVLHSNLRLRLLAYAYPFASAFFLGYTAIEHNMMVNRVRLFENYCQVRAKELFEQNKFMFNHEHFRRYVWFAQDLKDTLARVHRQANNHDASDFKDSELILQDFIRRYSDPRDPDSAIFRANGDIKVLN